MVSLQLRTATFLTVPTSRNGVVFHHSGILTIFDKPVYLND